MQVIDEVSDLLQSHVNRDKVASLTSYILKLWGTTSKSETLLAANARFVGARATMRLFDDAAAIKAIAAYGLGKSDGCFWGSLGIANGIFSLTYLQFEKVIWLIDVGVLKVSKEVDFGARTGHKLFWSLMAFVGFIRSLRALNHAARVLNSPQKPRCAGARYTQATLTSSKFLLDVIHVVSYLPRGWLWGGRLPAQHAAAAATASAVLALLIHYKGKRLTSSR